MRACNQYSGLDYPETPHLFLEFHGSEAEVRIDRSLTFNEQIKRSSKRNFNSVPNCNILPLQVAAQTETVKEIANDQVWFLLIKLSWQIFQYCFCGGSAQTSSNIITTNIAGG